jgi:hypothetical protein
MKFRSKTLSILSAIVLLTACATDSDSIKGTYSSMRYVTQGAGQIDFILTPATSSGKLKAIVSKYNFRDTILTVNVDSDSYNSTAFLDLRKAMNSQIQLNGSFKQSTLLTGTWTSIYLVANGRETEVTNTQLRNSLLLFGQAVRNQIK